MSAPLAAGDEAWALIQTPPTPSGRRTVIGAARVLVEAIADDREFVVSVLAGSGVPAGPLARHRLARHDLFARRDPAEHQAFADAVRRIWGTGGAA